MEDKDETFSEPNLNFSNSTQNDDNSTLFEQREREITQTDHLNKQLLSAFLEKMNNMSNNERQCSDDEDTEKTNEREWSDSPQDKKLDLLSNGQHNEACTSIHKNFLVVGISGDHFFYSALRARLTKDEENLYKPKPLDQPRGEHPIRAQYGYKINEAKLLSSKRLGIEFD